jgi:hypothetical protein
MSIGDMGSEEPNAAFPKRARSVIERALTFTHEHTRTLTDTSPSRVPLHDLAVAI